MSVMLRLKPSFKIKTKEYKVFTPISWTVFTHKEQVKLFKIQ